MSDSADQKQKTTSSSNGNKDVATTPAKTLLILIAKPDSLKSAIQFLRSREWQIHTALSLKEFITHLIQGPPSYIMVAADHPNKKAKALPRVIAQAFPVRVIGFTDTASTSSFTDLQDMKLDYSIFPPISGPAIERTINKILKDEQSRSELKLNSPEGSAAASVGAGSQNSSDSQNQALIVLNQLISDKDDSGSESNIHLSSQGADGPNNYLSKGERPSGQNGPAGFIPTNKNSSGNNPEGFIPSDGNGSESFAEWNERTRRQAGASFQSTPQVPSNQNSPQDGNGNFQPLSKKGNHGSNYSNDQKAKDGSFSNHPYPGIHQAPKTEYAPLRKNQQNTNTNSISDSKTGQVYNSIIEQGTQRALDESVVVSSTPHKPIDKLESTQNSFCILVESSRFKGYLVAALGKNRKIDNIFIKNVETKLFEFLKSQGEELESETSIEINLKQVQFDSWAIEHAEFLRKSIHNGNEIAMAFFPIASTKPKIGESKRDDMVSISIDDLKGDIQVLFDVYMYMPANKKYILYTPTGGMFYSRQKDRLRERGITHLHMKKDNLTDVKKYQAQNYLNDKIDEYHNKGIAKKKLG